jgi:hypothetical protein
LPLCTSSCAVCASAQLHQEQSNMDTILFMALPPSRRLDCAPIMERD